MGLASLSPSLLPLVKGPFAAPMWTTTPHGVDSPASWRAGPFQELPSVRVSPNGASGASGPRCDSLRTARAVWKAASTSVMIRITCEVFIPLYRQVARPVGRHGARRFTPTVDRPQPAWARSWPRPGLETAPRGLASGVGIAASLDPGLVVYPAGDDVVDAGSASGPDGPAQRRSREVRT